MCGQILGWGTWMTVTLANRARVVAPTCDPHHRAVCHEMDWNLAVYFQCDDSGRKCLDGLRLSSHPQIRSAHRNPVQPAALAWPEP